MTALLDDPSDARRVVSPNRSRLDSILGRGRNKRSAPASTKSATLENADAIAIADDEDATPTTPTPPMSPSTSSKGSSASTPLHCADRAPTKIRFSEQDDKVLEIPSRDDYSSNDMHTLFFQNFEYQQIKANNKILVRMMDDPCTNGTNGANFEDDLKYCFRGLEHRSSKEAPSRKYNKTMAARAVFMEQFRLCREGTIHANGSAETIRTAYRAVSLDSQQNARRWGIIDEHYVRKMNDGAEAAAKVVEEAERERELELEVVDSTCSDHVTESGNSDENTDPRVFASVNRDDGKHQKLEGSVFGDRNLNDLSNKRDGPESTQPAAQPIKDKGPQPLLEFEQTESMCAATCNVVVAAREDCTLSERRPVIGAALWPLEMGPFGLMDEILLTRNSPRLPPVSPTQAAIA